MGFFDGVNEAWGGGVCKKFIYEQIGSAVTA